MGFFFYSCSELFAFKSQNQREPFDSITNLHDVHHSLTGLVPICRHDDTLACRQAARLHHQSWEVGPFDTFQQVSMFKQMPYGAILLQNHVCQAEWRLSKHSSCFMASFTLKTFPSVGFSSSYQTQSSHLLHH